MTPHLPAKRNAMRGRFAVAIERHPSFPELRTATVVVSPEDIGPGLLTDPHDPQRVVLASVERDRFTASPESYRAYTGKLVVEMGPDPSPRIARILRDLRRLRAQARFAAEELGDGSVPMMVASAGVPVILETDGEAAPSAVHTVLEYFLTSPTLETPIEPFLSLARHLGEDTDHSPTLRDLYKERLGLHLFVTEDRRVTISPRLARRGAFLGNLGDGIDAWRASPLWKHLARFEHRVFATLERCAFCVHYRPCRGFLRGWELRETSCAPWEDVLGGLRKSYLATLREAARTRTEFEPESSVNGD